MNEMPIMNQQNFPANSMMAPSQQPPQMNSHQQIDEMAKNVRFPSVNVQELDNLTTREDKAKFVGNAIFFPI